MELEAKENIGAQPESADRTERRLARGLEDVLHLFLTPSPGRRAAEERQGISLDPIPADPDLPAPQILVSASTAMERDLLIAFLKDNPACLEEGMKAIDANVPCAPFGFIDIVAVERRGRICVVNVDTVQSDLSILRGIADVDWMVRNRPIVERLYENQGIDFSLSPHLFLVAPRFSPLLHCVAQRIVSPRVHCFEYRAAEINGTLGILLERA